ncbi:hypothetical protein BDY21DRAFT_333421 [Lineolata rhizophorae]|uniref:Uncharacterized protein n=1 Tax=Lineolata rhizophorae TaxID=578093 RepID=A0A6A6PA47_9PEZI|nr:hypothetical protein BDY21DRAFT_333421 [Lineolata rhizophorae]
MHDRIPTLLPAACRTKEKRTVSPPTLLACVQQEFRVSFFFSPCLFAPPVLSTPRTSANRSRFPNRAWSAVAACDARGRSISQLSASNRLGGLVVVSTCPLEWLGWRAVAAPARRASPVVARCFRHETGSAPRRPIQISPSPGGESRPSAYICMHPWGLRQARLCKRCVCTE